MRAAQGAVFVDTNVLIYLSRPSSSHHEVARGALDTASESDRQLWISPQVLREYLAAATRPQTSGPSLPMSAAIGDVIRFRSEFHLSDERPDQLDRLLRLLSRYPGAGKQVHDANLVAAMQSVGITRLLTFNTADFRRFASLITLEPL